MAFGGYLKQSTAVDVLIGPFVDDTDGKTAETGLTLAQADIKLSKNGQTLAQKNDDTSASHDADGYYNCELDATDTGTLGTLVLIVNESGALPVRHEFQVVTANWWDSMCSTDQLDVNVTNIEGSDAIDQINAACDTALTDYDAVVPGDLPTNFGSMGIEADGHVHADVKEIEGSDATDQIRDAVVDDGTRIDASALNTLSGHDPGENIAGTSEIAALNDPTAASIADAVWDEAKSGHTAGGSFGEEVQAHSLSSEVAALNDFDPTSDQVIVVTNNDKTGYALSSAGIDSIIDEVVEGAITMRQALRIMLAALAGLTNGGGTATLNFRDVGDTKNRIQATVDSNQNRTGITLDGT